MKFTVLPTDGGALFEIVYNTLENKPFGADCLHVGVKVLNPENEKIVRDLFPDINDVDYELINIGDEENELSINHTNVDDPEIIRYRFRIPVISHEDAQKKAFEHLKYYLGEVDYSAIPVESWRGFDEYVVSLTGL